jgi:hypothetical protein
MVDKHDQDRYQCAKGPRTEAHLHHVEYMEGAISKSVFAMTLSQVQNTITNDVELYQAAWMRMLRSQSR